MKFCCFRDVYVGKLESKVKIELLKKIIVDILKNEGDGCSKEEVYGDFKNVGNVYFLILVVIYRCLFLYVYLY